MKKKTERISSLSDAYYRRPKTTRQLREAAASTVERRDDPDAIPFRGKQRSQPSAWDDVVPDQSKYQWVKAMKRMLKRGDTQARVVRRLQKKWGVPPAEAIAVVADEAKRLERHGLRLNPLAGPTVSVRREGTKFAVIIDGVATGKYAFSREKAATIGRKLVGMHRNPKEAFLGENDLRALAEEIRQDSMRGDAPFGWYSSAVDTQIAELFDPAPHKRAMALRKAASYLERLAFTSPYPEMHRERARELLAEARRLSSL